MRTSVRRLRARRRREVLVYAWLMPASTVAQENGRFSVWAVIVRYRADQATPSMLMPQLPRQTAPTTGVPR